MENYSLMAVMTLLDLALGNEREE